METDPLCEALPNPNSISRLVRKKPKSIKSPWKMLIASNNSGSGRQRLLNPGESGGLLWRPAWGGDWSLHRWSHTFVALCDEWLSSGVPTQLCSFFHFTSVAMIWKDPQSHEMGKINLPHTTDQGWNLTSPVCALWHENHLSSSVHTAQAWETLGPTRLSEPVSHTAVTFMSLTSSAQKCEWRSGREGEGQKLHSFYRTIIIILCYSWWQFLSYCYWVTKATAPWKYSHREVKWRQGSVPCCLWSAQGSLFSGQGGLLCWDNVPGPQRQTQKEDLCF